MQKLISLTLLLLLFGCGDPPGTACSMTGSGFSASDNCRHRCLQHQNIVCPDGNSISPDICSGKRQCNPGGCPDGQLCYHVNDPFEKESYCVVADICGVQTLDVLAAWEQSSLKAAEESMAIWTEKQNRRGELKVTAPAEKQPSDNQ